MVRAEIVVGTVRSVLRRSCSGCLSIPRRRRGKRSAGSRPRNWPCRICSPGSSAGSAARLNCAISPRLWARCSELRERRSTVAVGDDAAIDPRLSPLEDAVWKEYLTWLWNEIGTLSARQRRAFLLHSEVLREFELLGVASIRSIATDARTGGDGIGGALESPAARRSHDGEMLACTPSAGDQSAAGGADETRRGLARVEFRRR